MEVAARQAYIGKLGVRHFAQPIKSPPVFPHAKESCDAHEHTRRNGWTPGGMRIVGREITSAHGHVPSSVKARRTPTVTGRMVTAKARCGPFRGRWYFAIGGLINPTNVSNLYDQYQ
ncbi:hypothetical protein [Mesorhizobium sp. A623]